MTNSTNTVPRMLLERFQNIINVYFMLHVEDCIEVTLHQHSWSIFTSVAETIHRMLLQHSLSILIECWHCRHWQPGNSILMQSFRETSKYILWMYSRLHLLEYSPGPVTLYSKFHYPKLLALRAFSRESEAGRLCIKTLWKLHSTSEKSLFLRASDNRIHSCDVLHNVSHDEENVATLATLASPTLIVG